MISVNRTHCSCSTQNFFVHKSCFSSKFKFVICACSAQALLWPVLNKILQFFWYCSLLIISVDKLMFEWEKLGIFFFFQTFVECGVCSVLYSCFWWDYFRVEAALRQLKIVRLQPEESSSPYEVKTKDNTRNILKHGKANSLKTSGKNGIYVYFF